MPVSQAYQGIAGTVFSGLKGERPAPKAGALPTALHPVISLFYPAGRILPNQARYQLRYTRIFNFCHDTTASGKNKDFSVCGHSCGQSHFYAVFGNRCKSSKHRRHKTLRRFASPYPGYNHGTPKPGAIPVSLYPDMRVSADKHSAIIAKAAGECKHFLILKKN